MEVALPDFGFGGQAGQVAQLASRYARFARSGGLTRLLKRPRLDGKTAFSFVKTETEDQEMGTGDPADYTRTRLRRGRKPRQNLRQLWKLNRVNNSRVIYGSQQLKTYSSGFGSTFLSNNATDSASVLTCPCHIYDITAAPNTVGNGTTITNPLFRYIPTFSNNTSSGVLSWNLDTVLATQQGTGPQNGSTVNAPVEKSMLDYLNAKFLFYAPTALPVRIDVKIFQITDERLIPAFDGQTTDDTFATAFYQGMLKRYMFNPLETGAPDYHGNFKVMASRTLYFQPKESTESVTTKMKQMDIFMRFNRLCNYRWRQRDKMAMLQDDPQQNDNGSLMFENTVHPRARIFLGIFAQAGASTTADQTTVHPSYDFKIQMKHSQIN